MLSGETPGRILELNNDRTVMGRYPDCSVILENISVSRHHAQILKIEDQFFLEDLRSRNGTFLNGELVEGRVEIDDRDKIRVCDIHLRFLAERPIADDTRDSELIPPTQQKTMIEEGLMTMDDDSLPLARVDGNSSIIQTIGTGSRAGEHNFGVDPDTRLRAILKITEAIGHTLDLDQLLDRILDSLFEIFPQADTGIFIFKDDDNSSSDDEPAMVVKAEKVRNNQDNSGYVHSSTIVKRAMESGEAVLSANIQDDTRFRTSESIPELSIRSMMCVPLITKANESIGVIELDTKDFNQEFDSDDLELLVSVASQASMAVENARLHKELLDQRDLERDLEFANQIQLDFLPQERPQFDEYEFYDHYEAAMRVGGDYFDYIPLPDGKVVIAQGDVSGKGVPAALLMARLYASVRYRFLAEPTPVKAVEALNQDIMIGGLGFRFITFVVIVLDPVKHEVTIVSAGHLPPLFRRADESIDFMGLEQSGVPLGITTNVDYQELVLPMNPGDSIVLYTDGVTEMMDSDMKLFGRQKLKEAVAELPHDINKTIKGIVDHVEDYGGDRSPRDDMCLVGFRRIVK